MSRAVNHFAKLLRRALAVLRSVAHFNCYSYEEQEKDLFKGVPHTRSSVPSFWNLTQFLSSGSWHTNHHNKCGGCPMIFR
jgi:hypothetical protein